MIKNKKNFKIDIWETDFRVIVSGHMINKIKIRIKKPYLLYKKTTITPAIYYRLLNGKGINIKNYYKVIKYAHLSKLEAENSIKRVTYRGCNRTYPFIKYFDPLMFRVICHIIGDGNKVDKRTNTFRWIQKNKNSEKFINLIKLKIGHSPKVIVNQDSECAYITINAFFIKLAKYALKIDVENIKCAKTIREFIKLPRDYLIQLLTAFILDEGCIRYGKARSLIISQSEKTILTEIRNILDKLNYQHSEIYEETSRKYNTKVHRINIYGLGVLSFYKDLKKTIKNYGNYAGLWHKQENLNQYIKTLNPDIKYSKLEKDKVNSILISLAKKNTNLSLENIRNHPPLKDKLKKMSHRYLINKFYNLNKQKSFIRVSRGSYKLAR